MINQNELRQLGLRVDTISYTPNPQTVCYMAMHQDYSEGYVVEEMFQPWGENFWNLAEDPDVKDPINPDSFLTEQKAGKRVIEKCAKFRHFGPLEHPQIVVGVKGFPHTMIQQLRTHRTGISFDVQSGRYTGVRLIDAHERLKLTPGLDERFSIVSEVFFIRQGGKYKDRFSHGIDWELSNEVKFELVSHFSDVLRKYYIGTKEMGMPPEMARDLYVPYSVRQNFVLSCNLRTALHLLEMRYKKDASLECQWFSHLFYEVLEKWAPEIMDWWLEERGFKNQIAP